MKHFLINITVFLALSFLFQEIDINALRKDPTLIQYKKLMIELMNGDYRTPRDPNIMKEFGKNPTKENMKKLYKDAGMKNASEYVDKMYLRTSLMFDFLKKHPEISKLDAAKKQEVLKALLID